MFVADEVRVEISATAAAARLASLILGNSLTRASQQAWCDGIARVGPVPRLSKLVRVQFREPVRHGAVTMQTLRWEATGTAGRIFPVLDADMILVPDGEESALLGLDGAYRPPGGAAGAGLDRLLLHRIAAATVHSFLTRMADAITGPAGTADHSEATVTPTAAADRLAVESC
jgi:hypothetical protein